MQILDILTSSQGGSVAANLAKTYNIAPQQAETALQSIVEQLTGRMERNSLSRGGLADLVKTMGGTDRSGYLQDPTKLDSSEITRDGNAILEQILGSKDMSRKVAARTARQTGLGESVLKQLLPVVAAMTMGGLAKATKGPLGQIMSQFGGLDDTTSTRLPTQRPPLAPGKSPLPIPGDDLPGLGRRGAAPSGNPLDDLSDILRRGGRGGGMSLPRAPGAGGSSGLWSIIRSILGSVLGFQSQGFISWLVRLIVFKWGMGFLRRILTRMLTGR